MMEARSLRLRGFANVGYSGSKTLLCDEELG